MAALIHCFNGTRTPLVELRSWNKIVKEQVLGGNSKQALLTYKTMLQNGYSGDNYTFPVLLKAATQVSYLDIGYVLHGQTMKTGFWMHDFVQTALLNLYSALGHLENACKVFKAMTKKDLIAFNSMLEAYASAGEMDDAAALFNSMPVNDHISFNIMISGFGNIGNVVSARHFFDKMTNPDVISWNSVICAYAAAGEMSTACELFQRMPQRNVASWNTILCGYLQIELYKDVIDLFTEVCNGELEPNHITLTTVLSACARMGALDIGVEIHKYAMYKGLNMNLHVTASLIDMYAKCGSIERALEMFYKFESKDKYCWNVIISGLALHGNGHAALDLFKVMQTRGLSPDDITFIGLLSACSHAGLVEEGCQLFESMENMFGISPKSEHYGCMVDLLSRAGFLNRAVRLIETMPYEPGVTTWGALLRACIIHQDFEKGEMVAKYLTARVDCLGDGEYIMLANLYSLCGRWDEADRWRAMMDHSGINKTAGFSMIEVKGTMYKFLAGGIK
ncbi:Pentatricopeptide repeat-containing protein [Thalictrum thalictroides]|uniref:Pentatricopeptide repeat-containing protein n=1 Tax=Thalictrum thalictroides TaxID=46969 RepID=A0A7J6V996_THATH|nr:Pentatricopeptide repeat-containing protein [Thalictrum thalictroides]